MPLAERGRAVAVQAKHLGHRGAVLGTCPVAPGKAVAISVMKPMFAVWWLRPVFRAARVGEQRAVVWKLL